MRIGYLITVAIVPLIMITTSSFEQGKGQDKNKGPKDKNHSENHQKEDKGNNKNFDKGKPEKDFKKLGKEIDKSNKSWEKEANKKYKEEERWVDGKWDDDRFAYRMSKLKGNKKDKWVNQNYYPGIVWFTGENYYDAKYPKNSKKVNICHKPNGSDYPVMINVSENAVQAHLNHGDYLGECKDWDRSPHSDTYWETRNNYYNQYVETTETLSLGEQLLALAISKLTNSQQQLTAQRPTLSSQQISNRELAIINLQNDTYDLRNSLDNGNNKVINVNFGF
ncbi:hypothetical protein A5893_12645 [Pedobacter psychrophilus]|uniref:Uncharacterized protein n=1 Tax=Pedobacter psychrophilus TaxID=1826909 RepID=A0A179DEJ4_9SPHI|nr:hypothetical protein [Pedobacter psychrophilus]OAQ38883.1 hypothetical protein A5893_12645 [Pedobacter psychrophilus]